MKNNKTSVAVGITALLVLGGILWATKDDYKARTEGDSIVGCYVSRTGRDVYTLNIAEQKGEEVYGKLSFKNFEKDSSSGTFDGVYKDGVLLGEYAFQSEGTDSVMEVAFQRSGQDFVRGYGEVNSEGNKFIDPSALNYDASSSLNVFKKEDCAEEVNYKTYSSGELGLEFKYRGSPDGYVLREISPSPAESASGLVSTLILVPEADSGAEMPVGGETPPAITLRVVKNDKKEWPAVWAEANNIWSNINLKLADPVEYTVGGAKAVRYPADGLYMSDNVVATHGEFAYVISGAYMDEDSDIRQDFLPFVESIVFVPASLPS
jgi:hypothetical protein